MHKDKMMKDTRLFFISHPVTAVLLLGALFFCVPPAYGQNEGQPLTINVSKRKMAVNENLTVEISTSLPVDQFAGPAFENFNILSGPNTMRSMVANYANGQGRMEQKTSVTYLVQPKKEGTLYIEPAMIASKGRKYQTKSLAIEVGKAIEGQQTAQIAGNPSASARDNIHLVAEVSDRNPYVGEPFTVTYKLYYRMNIGNLSASQVPKFDSFWMQAYTKDDLPESQSPQRGYYRDELYNVVTFYKVLLQPQKEGPQTIPPISLTMLTEVGTGQYDYWGDEITRTAQHSVSSAPINISVRALPQKGRPDNFSGAVGQFTMNTSLSKREANTGESVTLTIDVRGNGNISQIKMPEPVFPDEIERYDPKLQTTSALTPTTLRGSLNEQFVLIPRVKGEYGIPKIEFSYFDPASGQYVTLSSEEMTLKVSGEAISGSSLPAHSPKAAEKSDVKYLGNDIGFIRLTTSLQGASQKPFYNDSWYWVLFLLPLALIPLAIAKRVYDASVDRNSPDAKAKRAARIARARLSKARKALDKKDYQAFYGETEKALYTFISSKLKLSRKDASIDRIHREALARGANETIAGELIASLEACNQARYAGFDPSRAEADYQATVSTIVQVNKSIKG